MNDFIYEKSNKIYNNSSNDHIVVNNTVFFNNLTKFHRLITHLAHDFFYLINIFYNKLIQNKNLEIIIEYVPDGGNLSPNEEISDESLKKFISFLRDINIDNKIIIISNYEEFQNFNKRNLFI